MVLLGDQQSACLGSITPAAVVGAVDRLTRHPMDDVREVARVTALRAAASTRGSWP
ncbi:MAG TPA: hypothetical protein VK401_11640 [Propionibacteriaceae bacterium]|nr:hypothetical protein [Propionibacteriaceae bacterium]